MKNRIIHTSENQVKEVIEYLKHQMNINENCLNSKMVIKEIYFLLEND